jgi:hypothetical protein
MLRKRKECVKCGELKLIYARKMCKYCDAIENPGKHGQKPLSYIKPKKSYAIPNRTNKRLKQEALYRKKRGPYLEAHPICEVHDCERPSTNIHHKKGRIEKLVHDERYFMACCGLCHPRRIHETETAWAKEHGYIL